MLQLQYAMNAKPYTHKLHLPHLMLYVSQPQNHLVTDDLAPEKPILTLVRLNLRLNLNSAQNTLSNSTITLLPL